MFVYNKSNQKRLHMIIDYYPKNGVINDQSKISINHNLENKVMSVIQRFDLFIIRKYIYRI